MTTSHPGALKRRAAILLAKASITGAASREMEELAQRQQAAGGFGRVVHAFSEQGSPGLREVLDVLHAVPGTTWDEVVIVGCLLPMEPGYRAWITGAVQRWREDRRAVAPGKPDPLITLAVPTPRLLDALVRGALVEASEPLPDKLASPAPGSIVPPQKRRVLVCQGGPCNDAGSGSVWRHLRNEQKRLDLRTAGDGMMSARSSCLGPCKLAPVVQVWPEGTYYGGIDEAGMDRIIASHLLAGEIVQDLAYKALAGRQTLR